MSKQRSPWLPPFVCLFVTFWWCARFLPVTEAFPARPLNERSTELSWQAWLLVDQSKRDRDSGNPRRRITPKSVFIAPTFNLDALPACADGYTSDSMGRCIKVIKIDEAAHLDFLLQRLNEQFSDYDYEEERPLQLTIPLLDADERVMESSNKSTTTTEVAIVVAPTSATGGKTTLSLLDVKSMDRFDVNNVASILKVKPEDVETTTMDYSLPQTTTLFVEETTTDETTTTDGSTTADEGGATSTTTDSFPTTTDISGLLLS